MIYLLLILVYLTGAITSIIAIMGTRTAQGAIAWAISLNTIPYVALPAFWVFGRSKFRGYKKKRRGRIEGTSAHTKNFILQGREERFRPEANDKNAFLEYLTRLPATIKNEVKLLQNGVEIFPSLYEGIDQAKEYILIMFYIIRDDSTGTEMKERLISARKRGVCVYVIYDEVGSQQLSRKYIQDLLDVGVEIVPFSSTKRWDRLHLNFRNHRKIVIADGQVAWVGGANIGDEYCDKHPEFCPWLDAMVKVRGPAVQMIQVPWLEDWYWATETIPELNWQLEPAPSGTSQEVVCIPSAPADTFETCTLYFLNAINSAKERVWIASPYFVPDEQIVSALQIAALRGVDVRVLVPERSDNKLVNLSGWSYVPALEKAGAQFFRVTKGFLHYKAIIIDQDTSSVGTANFDNRSFRLNFEITIQVRDRAFTQEVEQMFERDFAQSRLVTEEELLKYNFFFRFAVRMARLMAPLQ